jgi:hypothetical protein
MPQNAGDCLCMTDFRQGQASAYIACISRLRSPKVLKFHYVAMNMSPVLAFAPPTGRDAGQRVLHGGAAW